MPVCGEQQMRVVPLSRVVDIEAVYEGLLLPAFPPSELITIDELRAGVATGAVDVVATVDEADVPVACAIGESPSSGGAALLAYLAVRQELRSSGLGGELLSQALARWTDLWQPGLILVEIENSVADRRDPAYGDPGAVALRPSWLGRLTYPISSRSGPSHERVYDVACCGRWPTLTGVEPDTAASEPVEGSWWST
jgi:GNAT superfamily N-acetyltransferase